MTGVRDGQILLIGGSGTVGTIAAGLIRRLVPKLKLAIGGRDLSKAADVAARLGHAAGVAVDLSVPGLGLDRGEDYSAVAVLVKDDWLNSLRFAQDRGIPYISMSSGAFEIAPEVGLYIRSPDKSAVILASQWLAGAATVPTLHFASEFARVDAIRIGALLDERDFGGPAAHVDYERITGRAPFAMIRKQYEYFWAGGETAKARITDSEGHIFAASAYSPMDAASLGAATNAPEVRLDLAVGKTPPSRRGEPFSTEISIEIEGVGAGGKAAFSAHRIVQAGGQAPLTALFVALCVERALGKSGPGPLKPGLYSPDIILDPAYAVGRLREFGARIVREK